MSENSMASLASKVARHNTTPILLIPMNNTLVHLYSQKASGATATSQRQALGPAKTNVGGKGKGKTIEEIYQKKTQLEHILLRPDTYIGSTEKQQQQMWVMDGDKMTLRTIGYVPGLYKIFDEILVNAADNKARDPSMDLLKVDINPVCC